MSSGAWWTTMARRRIDVFTLSFLDAMTCGFGAVVLLYMVINAAVGLRADRMTGDLRGEHGARHDAQGLGQLEYQAAHCGARLAAHNLFRRARAFGAFFTFFGGFAEAAAFFCGSVSESAFRLCA